MKKVTKQNQKNLKISEWATKNEAVKTSKPIYLSLALIKYSPSFFLNFCIKCVSVFYFLFNKNAKKECLRYQEQLQKYKPNALKKINVYKQIEAFAITLAEKLECWTKAKPTVKLEFYQDSLEELINRLNNGSGAVLLCSHLGNSEIFRNLANNHNIRLSKEVPISVLMDLGTTSNFTNALKMINPKFVQNIVDINNINPGTIQVLSDTIENGGIVIIAGDRVSKYNDNVNVQAKFLGKTASWPYGVYLITMLLKAPVYYMFGLRKKDISFDRKYEFHITKSSVNTNCKRNERETKIKELCLEYITEIEKHCERHPFQWYNFYNFWNISKN